MSDSKKIRAQSRRRFIKTSVLGGLTMAFSKTAFSKTALSSATPTYSPTPSETEGPFYPLSPQKDKDFDLTRVAGKQGVAKGRIIFIEGRVLGVDGAAIENAAVDLWQANAVGRYRHRRDRRRAPLDPNFQGWAIVQSGMQGGFRFKTILPGEYPASADWIRPPHIHFKISKPGFKALVTQMYFPGHPLNDSDLLLMQKSDADVQRMIAERDKVNADVFRYTVILEKI